MMTGTVASCMTSKNASRRLAPERLPSGRITFAGKPGDEWRAGAHHAQFRRAAGGAERLVAAGQRPRRENRVFSPG